MCGKNQNILIHFRTKWGHKIPSFLDGLRAGRGGPRNDRLADLKLQRQYKINRGQKIPNH